MQFYRYFLILCLGGCAHTSPLVLVEQIAEKQHRIENVEYTIIDRTQTLLKTVKSHPDPNIKAKALDGLFLIYGDPDESETQLAIHFDESSLQQTITDTQKLMQEKLTLQKDIKQQQPALWKATHREQSNSAVGRFVKSLIWPLTLGLGLLCIVLLYFKRFL